MFTLFKFADKSILKEHSLKEELFHLKKRNKEKVEQAKLYLDNRYVLHPQYKYTGDEKLTMLRSLAGKDYIIYPVVR
jgi:hypothetical protein